MSNEDTYREEVVRALGTAKARRERAKGPSIITSAPSLDTLSHGNVQAADAFPHGSATAIMPLPCGAFLALDDTNSVVGVGMPSERDGPCPRSLVRQLALATIAIRNMCEELRAAVEGVRERDAGTWEHSSAYRLLQFAKQVDAALTPFAEVDGNLSRMVSDEGDVVEEVRARDGVSTDG